MRLSNSQRITLIIIGGTVVALSISDWYQCINISQCIDYFVFPYNLVVGCVILFFGIYSTKVVDNLHENENAHDNTGSPRGFNIRHSKWNESDSNIGDGGGDFGGGGGD